MTTANLLARWSPALPVLLLLGGCIGSDAPSRGGWTRTIDTLPSDLGPVRSDLDFTSLPPPVVRGNTIVGVVTDDTGVEYVIRGRNEPEWRASRGRRKIVDVPPDPVQSYGIGKVCCVPARVPTSRFEMTIRSVAALVGLFLSWPPRPSPPLRSGRCGRGSRSAT